MQSIVGWVWDRKYNSHRVEGSIRARGNFFAEFILL